MEPTRNLPAIADLYSGDIDLKQGQNDLNKLLNHDPSKGWIKLHPIAKNVHYIPIQRLEWLMTKIFIEWNVEVKTIQMLANSIVVSVRVYYRDVLSNEMKWQDGIGAAPVHTKKGEGAMDTEKVLSDSVMKAAPAAESYAFKDACEKIGKLFGRDLNRADEIMYDTLNSVPERETKHEELFNEPKTETK